MTSLFDDQARGFELRAGLPDEARAAVARAVMRIGGLRPGDRLIDVGAGTGVIGRELVQAGLDYIGLDHSPAMLERFRASLGAGASPRLVVCDAREQWPVAPGTVRAVFGSRSLHWLAPEHVVAQTARLAHPRGCVLLIGRVERDAASVRSKLRRRLHELLEQRGIEPRSGKASAAVLESSSARAGASVLPPEEVASWTVSSNPRETLQAWRGKPQALGGAVLPRELAFAILDELETWTRAAFRNTDAARVEVERYVLRGAFFRARPPA